MVGEGGGENPLANLGVGQRDPTRIPWFRVRNEPPRTARAQLLIAELKEWQEWLDR